MRAKLLSEQSKKKQAVNQWNYQTLPCVELVLASEHECSCFPSGCKVLKSKYKIPKPIANMDRVLIQSVTSIDRKTLFSEINPLQSRYISGNRYAKQANYYSIVNEYLYISDKNAPKVITITGLFGDVLEASKFPSYCPSTNTDDACKSMFDYEFPIDTALIEPLIELSLNELLLIFSQGQEDLTNDSKDSNAEQSK